MVISYMRIISTTIAFSNQDIDEASMTMSVELQLAAKQRQVSAIAWGPGKNLLSTAFMLWMSGNSIQIFSIMMLGMSLMNPLKAIATVNDSFRRYEKEEGINLYIPKLTFLVFQLLSLSLAVYKCSTMGLLPLSSSDWVQYLPEVTYSEYSGVPM